ncbi:PAS domain S-box protein [Sulfuricurvum sp.]|uniref:PAS domain S-box protein n=1 Tax=Sulfuricurvum sp. TaxID=2025608 RepID=UPI003568AA15
MTLHRSLSIFLAISAVLLFTHIGYPITFALHFLMEIALIAAIALLIILTYKIKSLENERDSALKKQRADSKVLFLNSRYTSMGETVGNIAHQWKQPLNAIGSIQNNIKATLIFQGEISKEKLLNSVDTSFKLLQHLAETIDTFYSFLSQKNNANRSFLIADEFETIRKITEYSFENSRINLNFKLDVNPTIKGNPNEFTHAILNLILNAKDAFDEAPHDAATITVHVRGGEKNCTITVTDNAGGIRIQPVEMVFDLHITTKESGSGLGLFMTKNIIENRFGGTITVKNNKDGASFKIDLPYSQYDEYFADTVTSDERLSLERINQLTHKIIELEELEKTLIKWADIFKQAQWGIAMHVGKSNTFELTNAAFHKLYGYTTQEMSKLSVPDLFASESLPILPMIQKEAFEKGYVAFESIHKRKDGSTFPVSVELIVIKNEEDEILYHIANIWDLTQKKEAEDRLMLKKFALDHIKDAVFMIDENARFHYVNQGACASLGYTSEEFEGMNVGDVDPDWPRERWLEHWNELKQQGSFTMELRHKRKDGTLFPVEVSANFIEYNGKHYNMAIARDITERLQLEEQKENRRIRTITENSPDIIVRFDLEGRRTYVNPKAAQLFSIDTLGKTLSDVTPVINKEFFAENLKSVIRTKQEISFETAYIDASGKNGWADMRMVPEFGSDGTINSVLSIGRDITGRKHAEEVLALKEREFRSLAENTPDNIARWDANGGYLYINPVHERTLGISLVEAVGSYIPESHIEVKAAIAQVATTGQTIIVHQLVPGENGEMEIHDVTLVPERDDDGKIISILGIGRDMTDIYRLQDEITSREAQFRTLVENLPDNVIRYDTQSRSVYVSPTMARVVGDDAVAIIIGKTPSEIDQNSLEAERYQHALEQVMATGEMEEITIDVPLPFGEMQVHQIRFVAERDHMGEICGGLAIGTDITKRKRAEEALQSNRNLLHAILESSPGVVTFALDKDYRYIAFDSKHAVVMNTIFGIEIAVGMNMLEAIPSDTDREIAKRNFDRALSGENFIAEEEYGNERLSRKYWQIHYAPVRSETDEIIGLTCFNVDITQRKELEALLQKEHTFLIDAQRVAHTGSWHLDIKNDVLTWSDETYKIFELDKESVTDLHKTFYECVHPDDREMVNAPYLESLNTKIPYQIEHRIVMSDGRIKYVIERCEHTYDNDGTPLYSIGTVQDLSERKQTEEIIKELNNTIEKRVRERTAQFQEAVTTLHREINDRKIRR